MDAMLILGLLLGAGVIGVALVAAARVVAQAVGAFLGAHEFDGDCDR